MSQEQNEIEILLILIEKLQESIRLLEKLSTKNAENIALAFKSIEALNDRISKLEKNTPNNND